MPKEKLKEYKNKRDFRKTPEPEARDKRGKAIFVIQKHDAQNLHYDFRLAIDGVLVSWAVPKGLSTKANEKRLAIRTEDHPMGYADFEGVIPKDQYGGGTVLVWDKGTYNPLVKRDEHEKSVKEALKDGALKFNLDGEKLKGGYAMARTGTQNGGEQWVIFKLDDDHADARRKPVKTEPDSVLTGRSLEEIKKEEDPESPAINKGIMSDALKKILKKSGDKLEKKKQPGWTKPMLATLTHKHFSDQGWIYERKLDGVRCLFFKNGGNVRLMSRNKKEQNNFYPEIAEAAGRLSGDFIIDGELVTFDGNVSSFSRMQERMHVKNPGQDLLKDVPVYAYIFDILYLDGYDLTHLSLIERKKILKDAFDYKNPLRYLSHRRKEGEKYLEEACEKGWEGLIAKDGQSRYVHDRSTDWLKFKCEGGQEFVIGGYTGPEGERIGFGALLVGYYDNGDLKYAGKVGTGYNDEFLKNFHEKMEQKERKTSPFADFDEDKDNIHWVSPEFVGEVGFTEWTDEGKLRHPRFLGLRKDKDPKDVVKEAA